MCFEHFHHKGVLFEEENVAQNQYNRDIALNITYLIVCKMLTQWFSVCWDQFTYKEASPEQASGHVQSNCGFPTRVIRKGLGHG